MSRDWWSPGQRWLEQEALKESASQKRAWVKSGRSANTFRYNPPQWHRNAVEALERNDEETFKAIKLEQIGLPPLTSSRHQATKTPAAQLKREIAEVLAQRPAGRAHATTKQRANPVECMVTGPAASSFKARLSARAHDVAHATTNAARFADLVALRLDRGEAVTLPYAPTQEAIVELVRRGYRLVRSGLQGSPGLPFTTLKR